MSKRNKAYNDKNKEKRSQRNKDYYEQHTTEKAEYDKTYYKTRHEDEENQSQVPTTTLIPLRIAGRLSMMKYKHLMQKQTRKQKILKIHLVL